MTAGRSNAVTRSRHWCTPAKYVDAIRTVFGGAIDLDPCSNEHALVGARVEYRLPHTDGLAASWDFRRIYVNPPYGADRQRGTRIADWLARCLAAHLEHHSEVLALVPVAVNTRHWKDSVWGRARAVCFLADTRLKFIIDGHHDSKGAPMACSMVYWGRKGRLFERVFSAHGAVVFLGNQAGGRGEPAVTRRTRKRVEGVHQR
jgi:hypothetical protein